MQLGDIVVCMDGSDIGRERTSLALALAQRSGARVVGYHLAQRRSPAVERFLATPLSEADETAAIEFKRALDLKSLDGVWIAGSETQTVEDIAQHARCADLVVAGLGIPDDPRGDPQGFDFEQIVVECGRPVLGIPIANVSESMGQNIMVAWDGSRQSARVLHDALPFLRDAAMVKVVAIDIERTSVVSADNVIAHLKRLGVKAEVDTSFDMKLSIGEEILSRVEREEVDLLVAGAFGHSRLRERLVGGTSRTLLHQMMVPVLASH